ncbi:FERM domain-containing protein 5-like [Octopus sinensis]|uniref:FERM domain-containing protein 5-like n=1 Tax=Octopus sinensis TaxID=2607531 RepID=A0A6P7TRU7_9MOLL|nr:FERM domain-containing protein 5-like [Octopus sinensis]
MVFSLSNRLFNIGVHYLDDNKSYFQMKARAQGSELFDCICHLLGLEDKDYFGLQFIDRNGNLAWLDNEKTLKKQIWHLKNRELLFRVKFYIPDPSSLVNEFTSVRS